MKKAGMLTFEEIDKIEEIAVILGYTDWEDLMESR